MVRKKSLFEKLAAALTKFTGGTSAFMIAFGCVIIWAATGPLFDYSESGQLVINTGTTIITFLMVFIIQRAQNKDSHAIQLKLNELTTAVQGVSNRLIDAEDLSGKDLNTLKSHYTKLSKLFEKEVNIQQSHSIEEAEQRNKYKLANKNKKS